jgi:hypothetical protein
MKSISFLFAVLLFISLPAQSQDFEVPESVPSTKEDFIKSEKDVINAAKWLESTPIGQQMAKRKAINAWVINWIINSPTVTVNLKMPVVKLFDKNPELNAVYMAAYSRFCLENNYSKDEVKANVAAIKAVINCYNLGGDVKKNKALTAVMDKDKEGKLEEWVTENIR